MKAKLIIFFGLLAYCMDAFSSAETDWTFKTNENPVNNKSTTSISKGTNDDKYEYNISFYCIGHEGLLMKVATFEKDGETGLSPPHHNLYGQSFIKPIIRIGESKPQAIVMNQTSYANQFSIGFPRNAVIKQKTGGQVPVDYLIAKTAHDNGSIAIGDILPDSFLVANFNGSSKSVKEFFDNCPATKDWNNGDYGFANVKEASAELNRKLESYYSKDLKTGQPNANFLAVQIVDYFNSKGVSMFVKIVKSSGNDSADSLALSTLKSEYPVDFVRSQASGKITKANFTVKSPVWEGLGH